MGLFILNILYESNVAMRNYILDSMTWVQTLLVASINSGITSNG